MKDADTIAVLGLGYVGLPLAVALSRTHAVIGFDVQLARIQELGKGYDRNAEVEPDALAAAKIRFTCEEAPIADADVLIVAVPTSVDHAKRPDLEPLRRATCIAGKAMATHRPHGARRRPPVVIYESTVYPGCTGEVCVPLLEASSGLRNGEGFRVAYSPERINPGDREHTLESVVKVVAADDPETLERVASLYGTIVKAGIHRAPDIRTAEAAKVIENTQRDVNIALMNELAVLCHRLGIDTQEVLKAARTKWNFLPFGPGLVGGHCIPEDPYYLTHKAQAVGHHPELILAGRRQNDDMGRYIARETLRLLAEQKRHVPGARVLILGASFKEDVKDTRNTRVVDLAQELQSHGALVDVFDPLAGAEAVARLGLRPISGQPPGGTYDGIILAVPHRTFRELPLATLATWVRLADPAPFIDVKGIHHGKGTPAELRYWSL